MTPHGTDDIEVVGLGMFFEDLPVGRRFQVLLRPVHP